MLKPMICPKPLRPGATIGVFTPSSPGYTWNAGLFENGIKNLERLGFKVVLGSVTKARGAQGYRSASAQERAEEFMNLIEDPNVDGLMSTIGGYNSSSMIPFLDFDAIRDARKIMCGFSDVTSLHLAILKFSRLRTIYGPSVMCWFGDWPNGVPESDGWFLDAVQRHESGERTVVAPSRWSNHKRRWDNGDWKNLPREWYPNLGWRVLCAGHAEAPILALNLNTMLSAAGTPYWPDFGGKILLIEDMEALMSRTERGLRQLEYNGVFEEIAGLIIGKPEVFDQQGAPFGYDELFYEIVGQRPYPIVSNFDCSHTLPMISVPQLAPVRLEANEPKGPVRLTFLEGSTRDWSH